MAETALAAPIEALAGPVDRVTHHDAETGVGVPRLEARGRHDLVPGVGQRRAPGTAVRNGNARRRRSRLGGTMPGLDVRGRGPAPPWHGTGT